MTAVVLKRLWILGILVTGTVTSLFGQETSVPGKSKFGIQGGVLYSSTVIKHSPPVNNWSFIVVEPQPGYYLNVFRRKPLSDTWFSQLEVSFQQKGQNYKRPNDPQVTNRRYGYIGFSPNVGAQLATRVQVLVGAEINYLIRQKAVYEDPSLIEYGLHGRLAYQWQHVGFHVEYFSALNKYDKLDVFGIETSFINQNWKLGLIYNL